MLMENIGYMASSRNWIIDDNVYGIQGLMDDNWSRKLLEFRLAI